MSLFKKEKNIHKTIGKLVEGLPIPQDSSLQISLSSSTLKILGCNQEFTLDLNKILSVDVKTDVEMESIVKQSAPGMVIGAATFGLIGAMVGGRAKTKEKRKVSHFLIVNYDSNGLKTIIINTTEDWLNSAKLVDYFRSIHPDATPIKVSL